MVNWMLFRLNTCNDPTNYNKKDASARLAGATKPARSGHDSNIFAIGLILILWHFACLLLLLCLLVHVGSYCWSLIVMLIKYCRAQTSLVCCLQACHANNFQEVTLRQDRLARGEKWWMPIDKKSEQRSTTSSSKWTLTGPSSCDRASLQQHA